MNEEFEQKVCELTAAIDKYNTEKIERAKQNLAEKIAEIEAMTAKKHKVLEAARNMKELELVKQLVRQNSFYIHSDDHAMPIFLARALNIKRLNKSIQCDGLNYSGNTEDNTHVCVYGEIAPPGCKLVKVTKMVPRTEFVMDCTERKET